MKNIKILMGQFWGRNVKVEANYSEIKYHLVSVLEPLDGPKDFIQGTENYAMHSALIFKNKFPKSCSYPRKEWIMVL